MNSFDPNIHFQITNTIIIITNFSDFAFQLFDKATSYRSEIADAIEKNYIDPETDLYERLSKWDGIVHKTTINKVRTIAKCPTGLLYLLLDICKRFQFPYSMEDKRIRPEQDVSGIKPIPLREYQQEAVNNALKIGRGVIDSPPRSGKSRVFCEIVRCLFLPTIWIVPTDRIAKQSLNVVEEFLGKGIGIHHIGLSNLESIKHIKVVISTVATAAELPKEFYDTRNVIIFDEWHHGGSISAKKIFKKAENCYYRIGGTGTFFRDGADIIEMYSLLSNTIFKITSEELVKLGYLVPVKVFFIPVITNRVRSSSNRFTDGFGKVGIFENVYRNNLVVNAVKILYDKGKNILILVNTKTQGKLIYNSLIEIFGKNRESRFGIVENVSAETDRKVLTDILKSFENKEGNVRIVIGTSLLSEGVDLPNADALVLAKGGKGEVSLTQASFRVCTAVAHKKYGIIVDFADRHSARLIKHSMERLRVYASQSTFSIKILQGIEQLNLEVINGNND